MKLIYDMASHNLNLVKLSAKGTSSNYRIAAIDIDGKLYTAKPGQTLTYSSINGVYECGVASNGMLAFSFPSDQSVSFQMSSSSGRVYLGWVSGDEPGNWPY